MYRVLFCYNGKKDVLFLRLLSLCSLEVQLLQSHSPLKITEWLTRHILICLWFVLVLPAPEEEHQVRRALRAGGLALRRCCGRRVAWSCSKAGGFQDKNYSGVLPALNNESFGVFWCHFNDFLSLKVHIWESSCCTRILDFSFKKINLNCLLISSPPF